MRKEVKKKFCISIILLLAVIFASCHTDYDSDEKIREVKMLIMPALESEVNHNLQESRKYIQGKGNSHSVICKQRSRERELKQMLNQEREEKLKVQKQVTEKELENAQLKQEKKQQAREIEELKKQQIEQKLDLAEKMLKSKIAIELITSATGLTSENIEELI